MRILPFIVLLSALAIAGCAAYFSIVGLQLLFVGGGVAIVVMGVALEVGKLITATFLKQKWNEIGKLLKFYMVSATMILILITSVGIYGYLSAGYNATSVTVQGYERVIEANTLKIAELAKEILSLQSDKYNESEVATVEANRKLFIEQRMNLVADLNSQIEKIRASSVTQSSSDDLTAAKQGLELSKQALDSDVARELEQIKLYNSRLEILDKEVQRWLDEGRGTIFRKGGLDKAREVKESQKAERDDIDTQIKKSQDRIETLRAQYAEQVKQYNNRVAAIEARESNRRAETENSIKVLQQKIADTMASIDAYNKETDSNIAAMGGKKEELAQASKKKIEDHRVSIKTLHEESDEARKKIVHTDVGTFKFIAKSLNLKLDDAVNYFIWTIMFVFDPLAICLILAYNSMVGKNSPAKPIEEKKPRKPEPVHEEHICPEQPATGSVQCEHEHHHHHHRNKPKDIPVVNDVGRLNADVK